jgi:hypothetical protein
LQDPKFVLQLSQRGPPALVYLISHTMPWAESLANIYTSIDNYMVFVMHNLDTLSQSPNNTNPRLQQTIDFHRKFARDIMPFLSHFYHTNISASGQATTASRRLLVTNGTIDWKSSLSGIPITEDIGAIQAYSTLIMNGLTNPLLPEETAESWLKGPFQWPPVNTNMYSSCPAGEAIVNILVHAFSALKEHITHPKPILQYKHQRINATFPQIHYYNEPLPEYSSVETASSDSLVQFILQKLKSFIVDILNIDFKYVIGFLVGGTDSKTTQGLTAAKLAKDLLTCDFDSILTCKDKRTNTFVGSLSVLLLMMGFYFALGSSATLILSGISLPLFILYYVYGYSPMCIPMVPECAVADFLSIAKWFIPIRIDWPPLLQRIPDCALNKSIPHQDCFISCADHPFRYRSWEASIAWAACDYDPSWCKRTLEPWAFNNGFTLLWSEIR